MKHLYLAYKTYEPNIAATNRIIAYIKVLSKRNIKTTVIFFSPDSKFSKLNEKFYGVDFIYCWEKFGYPKIKILKVLFNKLFILWFRSILVHGDKVLVYGFPELIHCLVHKKTISVYDEMTEHPDAIGYRNPLTSVSWEAFYKDCKKLSGMFVISTGLKLHYIEQGVDPNKILIINMIVDAGRFYNVNKIECEDYIAYCGAVLNNKDGVDQLIKAFSIVALTHPKIKLYIIGPKSDNPDAIKNIELIKSLKLSDKVEVTGIVPYERIPQMLKNARILALDRPNNLQAQYGFPTKLGEYLLTENPVVVTRVGDIELFLEDGVNVFLSDPNNEEQFAEKLSWVIDHPTESFHIGTAGRDVALNYFNSEKETDKIIDFIFR